MDVDDDDDYALAPPDVPGQNCFLFNFCLNNFVEP